MKNKSWSDICSQSHKKNLVSDRATIINYNYKERERESYTSDVIDVIDTPSSPSSFLSKKEYVADATERCAESRILTNEPEKTNRPNHLLTADRKNGIIPTINQEDVEYMRVSVYRPNALTSTSNNVLRVNVSIKFVDQTRFEHLIDGNGWLKLVFRCGNRIRDLKRVEPQYADWIGYQEIRDFAMSHPVKFAGKGAFIGGGKKRNVTPPTAYYTALAVVSETSKGFHEPYVNIAIGNFRAELELYECDEKLFHSHAQYVLGTDAGLTS